MNSNLKKTSSAALCGRIITESSRLILREMTQEDFPLLCAMLQDPEVMYAWERTFSEKEVRDWIDRNQVRYRNCGCGYWLAFDRTSGENIGQLGILPEEIEGKVHSGVGWILRRAHWGKGYAAEGGKACLDYAFRELHVPRVIADIRPSNCRSVRVAERLGMEAMGIYDKVVGGKIMPHRIYSARSADRVQVPWNPIWEKQFAELEELLAPVLKHTGGSLRHIGGTSVPGSAAVPVIEAEYSPDPGISAARVIHELEPLGFYPLERESGNGLPDFTESLNLKFRHALRIRMI